MKYRVAVIEAKDDTHRAADGLAQAKEYAKMLGLQHACATNGHEILEFNCKTGKLKEIGCFPTPEELWKRVNPVPQDAAERILNNTRTTKQLRYDQEIAIDKALESILSGQKRVLLTLAAGTDIVRRLLSSSPLLANVSFFCC